VSVLEWEATLSLGAASRARDSLTSTGRPRWLVTCSCGWERETVSAWAARSVRKLHPQLAPMDVAHVPAWRGWMTVQASGSSP
jgi:hypothetical protein